MQTIVKIDEIAKERVLEWLEQLRAMNEKVYDIQKHLENPTYHQIEADYRVFMDYMVAMTQKEKDKIRKKYNLLNVEKDKWEGGIAILYENLDSALKHYKWAIKEAKRLKFQLQKQQKELFNLMSLDEHIIDFCKKQGKEIYYCGCGSILLDVDTIRIARQYHEKKGGYEILNGFNKNIIGFGDLYCEKCGKRVKATTMDHERRIVYLEEKVDVLVQVITKLTNKGNGGVNDGD